ncbi:hypothetical protein FRC00_001872 [Tulasnella sp. 408]|nr:hypothetical protein FRC00_001872 [Tulasnella sp. 408]
MDVDTKGPMDDSAPLDASAAANANPLAIDKSKIPRPYNQQQPTAFRHLDHLRWDRLHDPLDVARPWTAERLVAPVLARWTPQLAPAPRNRRVRPPHVLELLGVVAPRPPPVQHRVHVEDAEREQGFFTGPPGSGGSPPGSQGGRRVEDILNDNGSSERMLPPPVPGSSPPTASTATASAPNSYPQTPINDSPPQHSSNTAITGTASTRSSPRWFNAGSLAATATALNGAQYQAQMYSASQMAPQQHAQHQHQQMQQQQQQQQQVQVTGTGGRNDSPPLVLPPLMLPEKQRAFTIPAAPMSARSVGGSPRMRGF